MPHDAQGRRIERGDWVKVKTQTNPEQVVVGRVASLFEGQTCSGQLRWPGLGQLDEALFHAEDSELILKSNGAEPAMIDVGEEAAQV